MLIEGTSTQSEPKRRQASVLPVDGVEVLQNGAFVKPISTLSALDSAESGWEGVALESFDCVPGCTIAEHQHPEHFLSLQTEGVIEAEWTSSGETRRAVQEPGTIYVIPRGSRHSNGWTGTCSRLIVTMDSRFLANAVEETAHRSDVELVEQWELRDRHLASMMLSLRADLEDGQPAGRIYGESVAAAMGVYLVRRHSALRVKKGNAHGGLPKHRLKRVLDYVEQHTSEDISLSTLAGIACLSAHHFSELFRQSTGMSPYKYVIARRIEHAKQMLRESDVGILDVALANGFSDQSHFSKTFRRVTGMMPSAYRAGI